ncbi:MAG: tRNA lysidine(34) synthetase TilS, partial [Campylobacterota bacterium]|nr:tRNA lysidine(34) synthetase TilS [Campylobacterota bacterium]
KKNLLAFSAGIDSSALFFLLLENNIPFDIALVNYGTRFQSNEEEAHALKLADKYGLKAHTVKAPQWKSNFEANARKFRYDYFETLISEHSYDNLLTAHQLNDQLEWLFMRLSKGAGLSELVGLDEKSKRVTSSGSEYQLIRPILKKTKEELLEYLTQNNYPYFIDSSNSDTKFERNKFRKEYADPLIRSYADGIRNSFDYLHKDKDLLQNGIQLIFQQEKLRVLRLETPQLRAKAADMTLKELGYLLSADQRREIEQNSSIVIGGQWAVVYRDHRLYIAPFLTTVMPKEFKELCRVSSLPVKIRPYCFEKGITPGELMALTL